MPAARSSDSSGHDLAVIARNEVTKQSSLRFRMLQGCYWHHPATRAKIVRAAPKTGLLRCARNDEKRVDRSRVNAVCIRSASAFTRGSRRSWVSITSRPSRRAKYPCGRFCESSGAQLRPNRVRRQQMGQADDVEVISMGQRRAPGGGWWNARLDWFVTLRLAGHDNKFGTLLLFIRGLSPAGRTACPRRRNRPQCGGGPMVVCRLPPAPAGRFANRW